MKRRNEITIEQNYLYHLYMLDGVFFVDYYTGISYGFDTLSAGTVSITYNFS